MSISHIPSAMRRAVIERAKERCEYCLIPATVSFMPHEVDHVIAEKHGGKTIESNLAYACWRCNRYKGSDLGSFDPLSQEFSMLYHPRIQRWSSHFTMNTAQLEGLTAEGRTTVQLLRLNTKERLLERQVLMEQGVEFVPSDED